MHLGDGKTFTIPARSLLPANKYVQSATLNSGLWDKGWFRHQDTVQGEELVLEMGSSASAWGTQAPPLPSISRVEN